MNIVEEKKKKKRGGQVVGKKRKNEKGKIRRVGAFWVERFDSLLPKRPWPWPVI